MFHFKNSKIITHGYFIEEMQVNFLVKENGKLPSKSNEFDAGYDVYSSVDIDILPGLRKMVGTDLYLAENPSIQQKEDDVTKNKVPQLYLRIAPRSGLSVKGIDVQAGVVDITYRGEIKVVLANNSGDTFHIQKGDRIAQIIFEKCYFPKLFKVDEIVSTTRGDNGFGSSGK